MSNYRPISLTCVCSKIMERVIVQDLLDHLMRHGLISKQQHGFIMKRSTVTNLTETLNDWTLALDNKQSIAAAYVDFSKAFDTVCHSKLAKKLRAYVGVSGNLLLWISDFLAGRSQVTKVGNSQSSELSIISGVIQGSCLGPLLFLLFINDITDILPTNCKCKLYADDLKLYTSVNVGDCNTTAIQESLDVIYAWSRDWQLSISYAKCSLMFVGCHGSKPNDVLASVHIGNHVMQSVDTVKDLGVHVDENLKFTTHINMTVAKAQSRANLIHKCFISKDPTTLIRAFTTYVRPILEYASSIWSPYLVSAVSKIESVQRTFTKRIRSMRNLSYAERLSALALESLETRRLRLDLIYLYKILFGRVDVEWSNMFEFAPASRTRGHCYKLFVKRSRINIRQKIFCNRIVSVWNSLPAGPEHFCSLSAFIRFFRAADLSEWMSPHVMLTNVLLFLYCFYVFYDNCFMMPVSA